MGGDGAIDGIFGEDHRIVVGKGDAAAADLRCGLCDGFGRCPSAQPVILACFGDVPVLTESAAEVTPSGAKRQHAAAWVEVVERLLLDGVDAEAGRAPVARQDDAAIARLPHKTKAALALMQLTEARAKVALEAAV